MNAFIRVGSALFLVVCAMASRAREPGPAHSFGRLAGTLADQVGGRWEEREGILFGSDAKEDGTMTFACTVLPNLTAYPDAVPAWERSEERRVGKECTIQCRSRWSPYH